jgi:uncharacterized membrane protein
MPTPGLVEILPIVIIAAMFIAPVVWVVRMWARQGSGRQATPSDPALDALRTRFANGDIDQTEYERLRSVLQRG